MDDEQIINPEFYSRTRWQRWKTPILIFFLSLVVFASFSRKGPSADNHFVHLADSFLHGTVEMRTEPPHGNDWASYEIITLQSGQQLRGIWWNRGERKFMDLKGNLYIIDQSDMPRGVSPKKYFVSFPPFPAVLMLPGVAIWGMKFNDVWFTLVLAAFNVSICYVILRWLVLTKRSSLSIPEALWLTGMFGFGTAHLWCSVLGSVWFTALVIGVTCSLLYVWFSLDLRSPFWAGVFLACGFATRTPVLFSVVFFALMLLFPGGKFRKDFGRQFWRDGLIFGLVPLIVGCLLMWMNFVRFEKLSEFGHQYLSTGQIDRIKQYGLFNVHFISMNLAAMFALVPKFLPDAPYIQISKHGLALWFTTPALLYLAGQRDYRSTYDKFLRLSCWATIAVIAVPHILYQNTGWVQFGYRFSMDYMIYLVMLLAMGQRSLTPLFRVLVIVGVLVNSFGAVTFGRMNRYYAEWLLEE